jgi:hypothetical protein
LKEVVFSRKEHKAPSLDTVSISKGGEKEEETEIWGCLRGIS